MKSRRKKRKDKLINAHFLPFEAQAFSGVTVKEAPYLKDMIEGRRMLVKGLEAEAIYGNWSNTRFKRELRQLVRAIYVEEDWVVTLRTRKRTGKIGQADPWKLMKYYHDEYIINNPSWDSPSRKRRKHHKNPEDITPFDREKIREQRQRYNEKKRRQRERGEA